MTAPARRSPLRLVGPVNDPFDELLTALKRWGRTSPAGPAAASLEISDGELTGHISLTVFMVTELTMLLAGRTAAPPAPRRSPGHGRPGGR